MRTLKRTCPEINGELSKDKINRIFKYGVKIKAHTDSEPSEHGEDKDSDESKEDTLRNEQEGDHYKIDAFAE